jgi:hypothetical protein
MISRYNFPTSEARNVERLCAEAAIPQLDLPYHLEPGRSWTGMAHYDGKLKELAEKGTLYVGIYAVHYGKSILLKVRVKNDRALQEAKKNPRP